LKGETTLYSLLIELADADTSFSIDSAGNFSGSRTPSIIISGLGVVIIFYSLIREGFRERKKILLFFALFIIPLLITVLLSRFLLVNLKYFIPLLGPYLILIARGITEMRYKQIAIAILVVLLIMPQFLLNLYFTSPGFDNTKDTILYMKKHLQDGDRVYFTHCAFNEYLLVHGVKLKRWERALDKGKINPSLVDSIGRRWIIYSPHATVWEGKVLDMEQILKSYAKDECERRISGIDLTPEVTVAGVDVYLCSG